MSAARISATTTSCSTSKAMSSQPASMFWPSGHARSAAPRSARSGISRSCSGSRTTTRTTFPAIDMLLELMNDNKAQIHHMRAAHEVADEHEDVATASLLENFIDEAEKRCWFLFEASREAERSGH